MCCCPNRACTDVETIFIGVSAPLWNVLLPEPYMHRFWNDIHRCECAFMKCVWVRLYAMCCCPNRTCTYVVSIFIGVSGLYEMCCCPNRAMYRCWIDIHRCESTLMKSTVTDDNMHWCFHVERRARETFPWFKSQLPCWQIEIQSFITHTLVLSLEWEIEVKNSLNILYLSLAFGWFHGMFNRKVRLDLGITTNFKNSF